MNQPGTEALNIGYFGIPGSHTHAAALKYFGGEPHVFEGGARFPDVFSMVADGTTDRGVIPIENTLAGSLYENYDLLNEFGLPIVGEVSCKIEHSILMSAQAEAPKDDLGSVEQIFSHPKALEQCATFFRSHPWIEAVALSDTATAAQYVSEEARPEIAAIAGRQNADIYGLREIRAAVQDNDFNYTRFLVLANDATSAPEQPNKCSIMMNLPHIPGDLSEALGFLAAQGCNLTKIESRPIKDRPYEYSFYLDLVFGEANHDINGVIDAFRDRVPFLRVLGLYMSESSNKPD